MFRLLFVSALAVCALGVTPKVRPIVPMLDGRIVGGEDANITEFPYQLSLENRGNHTCGASVLTPTRALTAAHCTYSIPPIALKVRAGSSIRESGGQVVQVSSFAQHPKYNHRTLDYDVSVLRLALPLIFGPCVRPIALHGVGQELEDGELATVTGWGALSYGGSLSPVLQKVDVAKIYHIVCKSAYGYKIITDRMVCHGHKDGGKDSCQGDSGGPLVAHGKLVGVVSFGTRCAEKRYPGVYARTANEEIQEHIISNL